MFCNSILQNSQINQEIFLKPKPGARTFPDDQDQEMSSGSEFSSIACANDLTDLGELTELTRESAKKEEQTLAKGETQKVSTYCSD